MAMTISVTENWLAGNKRAIRGTVKFDTSYVAGGEAFSATLLGMGVLDYVEVFPVGGIVPTFDYTNNKLLAYYENYGPVATAGTTIVSGTSTTTQALATYSVPAGLINKAGSGLEAEFWGTAASSTTAKSALITFGTTLLVSTGSTAINGTAWYVSANVLTIDASDQEAIGFAQHTNVQDALTHSTPGMTLTTAVTLALQVVTANSADLTLTGYRVNVLNTKTTKGELAEVTAGTDLSGTTFRFNAFGV